MMSKFDCSEVTAAGYGNSNVAGGRNDGGGVDTNDNDRDGDDGDSNNNDAADEHKDDDDNYDGCMIL